MIANQVLAATVGGRSVILEGKLANDFTFIGSTFPDVGAEPGSTELHSLLMTPPQKNDEKGLIAVIVGTNQFSGKMGYYDYIPFFLVVSRVGEEPRIDLDNVFIPPQGRLGRIKNNPSAIEVFIDGVWLSSDPNDKERRIVPDTTLLCKYLAGLASADEVLAAASELIRQQNLDEKYQALLVAHRNLQIRQEEMGDLSLQLEYVQSLRKIEEGEKEDLAQKLQAKNTELQTANSCLSRIRDLTKTWRSAIWNISTIRAIVWPEEEFAG